MSDKLNRKHIPFDRRAGEKTAITIQLPYSKRFAYWAGKNDKELRQEWRLDDAAKKAYQRGVMDRENEPLPFTKENGDC